MRTIGIEGDPSYTCTGKIDWVIVCLSVLISMMEIITGINFSNEMYAADTGRQILLLIVAVGGMLLVSRISYRIFLKYARSVSAFFVVVLLIRYVLIEVDLIESSYYTGWLRLGSLYINVSVCLLFLGCFLLTSVGTAGYAGEIQRSVTGFLLDAGLVIVGLLLCGGRKYLILYLIVAGAILSIRFFKGRTFLLLLVFCVAAVILVLAVLSKYEGRLLGEYSMRIQDFLYPFDSFGRLDVANSLYMIHSGGLFGQGIGGRNGLFDGLTDDMYLVSKLVQDMGWIGLLCFILLFAALCWRIVLTIVKAPDRTDFYMGTSIFLLFLARFLVNLLVNLNLCPFVGVTLPFFGSGHTWAMLDFILLGVILNLSRYKIERV